MFFFELINNALKNTESYVYPENVRNIEIRGLASDSRNVGENYLFAAIPGYRDNGASFIQDAIALGASVILTEASDELCRRISSLCYVIRVKNVREAFALIVEEFYNRIDRNLMLFGVTGTNGKTSVTHLVSHIFNNLSVKTGIIGTLGGIVPEGLLPSDRTTPDILGLFGLFRDFLSLGVKSVAMEVSSHALELKRIYGLQFRYGIFTNLTEDHLDFHKSMEAYKKAKEKLFSQADTAIINIDDRYGREIAENLKTSRITYGTDTEADYRAENISFTAHGAAFTVRTPNKEQCEFKIPTPGLFSVSNALAAIALAVDYGFKADDVARALAEMKPVPGRFEPFSVGASPLVILDYAHTPDGIRNVLTTATQFTSGKLISVFGCGGNREKEKRRKMGEISSRLADYTVITSDNPRFENEISIAYEIASGFDSSNIRYNIIINREKAIEHAIRSADSSDTVIIMGKGHEAYQQFGDIKYPSDDKEIIQYMLNSIYGKREE